MFRILSLDGGGIRGAFGASFLARLQQNLNQPVVNYFDLIAGTSTGGLIAVALGMGVSPQEIKKLYQDEGESIFCRPRPRLPWLKRRLYDSMAQLIIGRDLIGDMDAEWFYDSKFSSGPLRGAIERRLGNRLLGEASCRMCIPSVDLTASKVAVFKTPHRPDFIRDRHRCATDVIMATTAAPSYFPSAAIDEGMFCDGGIWANNPALVGYVEAMIIATECRREDVDPRFTSEDVHVLSVGTGRFAYYTGKNFIGSGLRWWLPRLFNISGEAQSEGIDWQMRYLLGDRYVRVNFDVPAADWTLDSTTHLVDLLHLGDQRAIEHFPTLRGTFLAEPAPKYVPFPEN